ncbi:MAG: polyribonucleotide nucleotidyltransferase, partial [Saprospiraceae bacterium]|nr:polyribonucleotide nucleotidyltransferase [Saprospiraceae bacterium]
MGNQIPITSSFELPDGREVTLETGKLAAQAHGSALVRVGSTMLLATVVSNKEAKEGQPFFPLSVDYQEKFAAAGRIPGNFFRREAKLSDYEVLICRLVDRAIRPLFPDGYMNETQVIINLVSGDQDEMPDSLAALAASTALVVSDIRWDGPISEVRVARIDGEYVVNPIRSALANADIDIIVAATMKDVTMVEGEAKECSEADLVEAIRIGHEAIKIQCQAQLDLAQKVGEKATVKRVLPEKEEDEALKTWIKEFAAQGIFDLAAGSLPKQERKDGFSAILDDAKVKLTELHGEEYLEEKGALLDAYFDKLKKEVIRNMVLDTKKRLDGRDPDEIRPIWCEVDYLPAAHGSAVFTRGETQSLTTLTLGTKQDEVLIDTALRSYDDNFILHYNFPPYSTGEVKPMRGPGRREVGHANLAGRSVRQVMPQGLPYTIRLVSDILESNGSSSMATVCASSLALMDGGVQISEQIAGIAMGL